MKRRRATLALLLSTSAVAAILAWAGPDIYRVVAYEKHSASGTTFSVFVKRADWLPGPDSRIVDQVCAECQRGNHQGCYMSQIRFLEKFADKSASFTTRDGPSVAVPLFECTCDCPTPDPIIVPPVKGR